MSRTFSVYHQKIAVVVGGASGIGRAMCHALAQQGAVVIVADLDVKGAEQVADAIRQTGGQADAHEIDATNAEQAEQLVQNVLLERQRVDYMFNSVGLGIWGDVREVTGQQWRRVMDVNFWSIVQPTMAAYRVMAQRGCGHIVNLASLSGLVPVPTTIPYTAAKHATVGFSLALRDEAADLGVKISVACPGPVQSEFHNRILLAGGNGESREIPKGAIGVDAAAREILAATVANRRLIVFPSRFRWKWRLASWFPRYGSRLARAAVRRMRNKTGHV